MHYSLLGIWDINKIESAKNVCTRNYMEIPTYKGHYSKRTELCRLNIAKCHQHLMCFVVSWSIQSCAGPFSILGNNFWGISKTISFHGNVIDEVGVNGYSSLS
jgi:hypothetical protein